MQKFKVTVTYCGEVHEIVLRAYCVRTAVAQALKMLEGELDYFYSVSITASPLTQEGE